MIELKNRHSEFVEADAAKNLQRADECFHQVDSWASTAAKLAGMQRSSQTDRWLSRGNLSRFSSTLE